MKKLVTIFALFTMVMLTSFVEPSEIGGRKDDVNTGSFEIGGRKDDVKTGSYEIGGRKDDVNTGS